MKELLDKSFEQDRSGESGGETEGRDRKEPPSQSAPPAPLSAGLEYAEVVVGPVENSSPAPAAMYFFPEGYNTMPEEEKSRIRSELDRAFRALIDGRLDENGE